MISVVFLLRMIISLTVWTSRVVTWIASGSMFLLSHSGRYFFKPLWVIGRWFVRLAVWPIKIFIKRLQLALSLFIRELAKAILPKDVYDKLAKAEGWLSGKWKHSVGWTKLFIGILLFPWVPFFGLVLSAWGAINDYLDDEKPQRTKIGDTLRSAVEKDRERLDDKLIRFPKQIGHPLLRDLARLTPNRGAGFVEKQDGSYWYSGRAVANWVIREQTGPMIWRIPDSEDPEELVRIVSERAKLILYEIGRRGATGGNQIVFYASNPVQYIRYLNEGVSDQVKAGYIERVVAAHQRRLNRLVKKHFWHDQAVEEIEKYEDVVSEVKKAVRDVETIGVFEDAGEAFLDAASKLAAKAAIDTLTTRPQAAVAVGTVVGIGTSLLIEGDVEE